MKRKIILIYQFMLLICCAAAQSQEAVSELQKIKSYYAGPELKHVAGVMLLKNTGNGKAVDKVDFEYWAKDKQIFTKMSYIEILSNKDVYIMVNHKRKTIYGRSSADLAKKPDIGFFDPEQFSKILNTKGAVVTVTKSGENKKLTMSGLKNTSFSSFTITYAASDYKIVGVDATIAAVPNNTPEMKLEIKYRVSEKTTVTTDPAVFSAKKYIEKNNKGTNIYTQDYKSYQKL